MAEVLLYAWAIMFTVIAVIFGVWLLTQRKKYLGTTIDNTDDIPDISDYVKNRLKKRIDWYYKKAGTEKMKYHISQYVIIVASASIPIINFVPIEINTQIITSILGASIVAITGIHQLTKFQENWILYRSTGEKLRQEAYYFVNQVGNYEIDDEVKRHKGLVSICEEIVQAENDRFFVVHKGKDEQNI